MVLSVWNEEADTIFSLLPIVKTHKHSVGNSYNSSIETV